nr:MULTISPECIES: hypothetical protein [Pseudomonas]
MFVEVGSKEIVFIECKEHLPTGHVDHAEVEKWLKKRLPVLRDFAKHEDDFGKVKHTFELWTNAALSPASKVLIEEENSKTTRYAIAYREGPELLNMINESGNKSLLKTYKQHFSNHPMEIADRQKTNHKGSDDAAHVHE